MSAPLSDRFRPTSLQDVVGQPHLLSQESFLIKSIELQKPFSLLLFGPPGCGKTTLAKLYAQSFKAKFIQFSAVFHGIAELKKWIKESKEHPLFHSTLILFVDEIHRFNKAQQDLFLPFIEDGTLILIGATTENPSFCINDALLSRLRVLPLHALNEASLGKILNRFEQSIRPLPLTQDARQHLIQMAQGDGRHLLNLLENLEAHPSSTPPLDIEALEGLLQKRLALHDKKGEGHYNLISALHKAVRGSDPQAALYWLARLLNGGESPQFLCRRIIRMASEDIGLADPEALSIALNAWKAYEHLGSPEGDLCIAEAVIYLALAPKSNALYTAYGKAKEVAHQTSHLPPPPHILNAPTPLMKELGYGEGYCYDPDTPLGFSGQNYFPKDLPRTTFYTPVERGFEREMKKRIDYFQKLRDSLHTN